MRLKRKRQYIPVDDSWIDSFDPMPNRLRSTITDEEKANFAAKLANIDDEAAILDFFARIFQAKERRKHFANLRRLQILYRAQIFVRKKKTDILSKKILMRAAETL